MQAKLYNIIYKNKKFSNYEFLKSCRLSSGYSVFLFRGAITPNLFNYLVFVRKNDEIVEFHSLVQIYRPFSMYLDLICCYA